MWEYSRQIAAQNQQYYQQEEARNSPPHSQAQHHVKKPPLIRPLGTMHKTPPTSPSPGMSPARMSAYSRSLGLSPSTPLTPFASSFANGGSPSAIAAKMLASPSAAVEKELKYIYGSNSAARNLHSPEGYPPSTDDMVLSKMLSSISFDGPTIPAVTAHRPSFNKKNRAMKVGSDDNSDEGEPKDDNDANVNAEDDDELNSLGSEHIQPHPRAPPRSFGLGAANTLNLAQLGPPDTLLLAGTHVSRPRKKAADNDEDDDSDNESRDSDRPATGAISGTGLVLGMSMAQKARVRDEEIRARDQEEADRQDRRRLKALVEEHGLELASKIEGARRRRLKRRKHQLEEAPAIYALSGVGASLVPRHVSRTDAVPLAGIVSNCKWEEDWPTAQNMSRSLTTKKYKGKTIVVCPDLVDG
jgi:hypothetical protein